MHIKLSNTRIYKRLVVELNISINLLKLIFDYKALKVFPIATDLHISKVFTR